MTRITFIIPCFNELNHTKKTIQSIIQNSPQNMFNFVFIDNGSTDGTDKFLRTIPNSHIITNEKNIYVNPAWNQGFAYVLDNDLGDYVCLCNNDITVGRKWLEPIFHLFSTREDEFYAPQSNTQPEPAFNSQSGFRDYVEEVWSQPLEVTLITTLFMGFCIFMRKKDIEIFYPVPEQLKVLRGDDWIIDNLFFNGIIPYRVSRCVVHHFGGGTQRGMPIHRLRDQDHKEFQKLYDEFYRPRGMGHIHENKIKVSLL